jgi:hypothetical protein
MMFLILLRVVGTLPGQADPAQGSLPSAEVAADGRSFSIVAPGFTTFRAGFAAKVEIDGQFRIFDSRQGMVLEKVKQTSVPSPYGSMTLQTVVVRFEEEQIDLLFQLGIPENTPQVIMLQAGVRNQGRHAIRLAELIPLMMDAATTIKDDSAHRLKVSGKQGSWLLSGLHAMTPSLCHLDQLPSKTWIHEQGSLYHDDQAGFYFGPVGEPISYLSTLVEPLEHDHVRMVLVSPMDRVRVDAGQTRWGQQAGLFFEPPRQAMNRWVDLVVRTHGARTHRGALTGWSSVYSPERIARGKNVRQVIAQIPMSNGQLRPDVIQIGENFETEEGKPIDIASFYPEGYPDYAKQIAAVGSRPGMKLDFDLSRTNFQSCLAAVKRAVHDGFSYLKSDIIFLPHFARHWKAETRRASNGLVSIGTPYALRQERRPTFFFVNGSPIVRHWDSSMRAAPVLSPLVAACAMSCRMCCFRIISTIVGSRSIMIVFTWRPNSRISAPSSEVGL